VFTAKERDQEMGLDYFGARYYGSTLGRWTSPDEFKGGFDNLDGQPAFSPGPIGYADLSDPQTLNMYVYTRNNPLRFIDPDGHDFLDYLSGGSRDSPPVSRFPKTYVLAGHCFPGGSSREKSWRVLLNLNLQTPEHTVSVGPERIIATQKPRSGRACPAFG